MSPARKTAKKAAPVPAPAAKTPRKTAVGSEPAGSAAKKYRNFPLHDLAAALAVATTIRDVNAGDPMNRLLLADALGIKPSSSNYRDLLSSSLKYGLTTGTEKASDIALTELGTLATNGKATAEGQARRRAACAPAVFSKFYTDFNNSKVPAPEMLAKVLVTRYGVPEALADQCASLITTNGETVGIVRAISGSKHVLLDSPDAVVTPDAVDLEDEGEELEEEGAPDGDDGIPPAPEVEPPTSNKPRPIFLGHGKNKGPLDKMEKLLTGFGIPFKRAITEPNLGRPIPNKVRETMYACGSAILIFTKDERFLSEDGAEVWRPSENVVHELGAASLLYEDRIVIFKEAGLQLASNFSSIGYIEFEENAIEAKTAELLAELVGFGLVKITPA